MGKLVIAEALDGLNEHELRLAFMMLFAIAETSQRNALKAIDHAVTAMKTMKTRSNDEVTK